MRVHPYTHTITRVYVRVSMRVGPSLTRSTSFRSPARAMQFTFLNACINKSLLFFNRSALLASIHWSFGHLLMSSYFYTRKYLLNQNLRSNPLWNRRIYSEGFVPSCTVTIQKIEFRHSPFSKKQSNLTIDHLSLGVCVPGSQVLTYGPQILRKVRIWCFRIGRW